MGCGCPAKPRSLEPCTIPLTQRESSLLGPLDPRAFRILGNLYPCEPWDSCTIRTFVPFRPLDSYTFRILAPLCPCGPLSYCSIRIFSHRVDPCAFRTIGPLAPLRTFVSFRPLDLCVFRTLESLYACGPLDSWTIVSG